MPNHYVMEDLKLYTAERGIIRGCDTHDIVSVNFKMDKLSGMAIRKDYLDKYLSDSGYSLVYYSLGEKLIRKNGNYQNIGPIFKLSGAFSYEDGKICEIQPMFISNDIEN